MRHSFGSGNSSRNTFLSRKRQEDDIPIDNRYHHAKYPKYDKYNPHPRYNNLNYIHSNSKPPPGNNYYNSHYRGGNYYNSQKNYRRDFKKPYQKYSSPNANEDIRNISNCDLSPSPPSLSLKNSEDASFTRYDSNPNFNESNGSNSLNIKSLNKLVSNITQQNINIQIKLSTPKHLKYKNKHEEAKFEEDKFEEDEESPKFQFPKPSEKIHNFEPFHKSLIKIEENPLEHFELYPKNLLGKTKNNGASLSNSNKYLNNFKNILQLKSCYLLAKIPNWRLVTNYVPASALNKEKLENCLSLDEKNDGDWGLVPGNPALVFDEKYEENVDKCLEQNSSKKKQVEMAIYNFKFIISQYHYDILKIKNKLNQNKFKIDYLNIKQENLRNAVELKIKE